MRTSAAGYEARQWLTAPTGNPNSKSMESLRSGSGASPPGSGSCSGGASISRRPSFLTASSSDVRRIVTVPAIVDFNRGYNSLDEGDRAKKQDFLNLSVEKRRNIFAGNLGKSEADGDRRGRMQLSLPPPGSFLHVPDRKITILSPHTPNCTADFLQTCKAKPVNNRKSFVLPKLLLPNSESQVFYSG
ncbi:UNVERIFIED_CONTAM: hypothetical protein PYX00_005024 [Menopon gallinae]|uniref:Uncharacterized protein n=1 Tax=Menopon gallinae TaxID=328185 RepID=A0AAW2I723_9NEOP